jgi:hypothetical protein
VSEPVPNLVKIHRVVACELAEPGKRVGRGRSPVRLDVERVKALSDLLGEYQIHERARSGALMSRRDELSRDLVSSSQLARLSIEEFTMEADRPPGEKRARHCRALVHAPPTRARVDAADRELMRILAADPNPEHEPARRKRLDVCDLTCHERMKALPRSCSRNSKP